MWWYGLDVGIQDACRPNEEQQSTEMIEKTNFFQKDVYKPELSWYKYRKETKTVTETATQHKLVGEQHEQERNGRLCKRQHGINS